MPVSFLRGIIFSQRLSEDHRQEKFFDRFINIDFKEMLVIFRD
jgi:hypothetical protein